MNFSEIFIKIQKFSLVKMHLKMSEKWWQFCSEGNELTHCGIVTPYGDIDMGRDCNFKIMTISPSQGLDKMATVLQTTFSYTFY